MKALKKRLAKAKSSLKPKIEAAVRKLKAKIAKSEAAIKTLKAKISELTKQLGKANEMVRLCRNSRGQRRTMGSGALSCDADAG